MIIAIPLNEGRLTPHFGHCAEFAMITYDDTAGRIIDQHCLPAPPHQPGLLPGWLADQGAELVIAGGLGQRARDLLEAAGVQVIAGAPAEEPGALVRLWSEGGLSDGENQCDH